LKVADKTVGEPVCKFNGSSNSFVISNFNVFNVLDSSGMKTGFLNS